MTGTASTNTCASAAAIRWSTPPAPIPSRDAISSQEGPVPSAGSSVTVASRPWRRGTASPSTPALRPQLPQARRGRTHHPPSADLLLPRPPHPLPGAAVRLRGVRMHRLRPSVLFRGTERVLTVALVGASQAAFLWMFLSADALEQTARSEDVMRFARRLAPRHGRQRVALHAGFLRHRRGGLAAIAARHADRDRTRRHHGPAGGVCGGRPRVGARGADRGGRPARRGRPFTAVLAGAPVGVSRDARTLHTGHVDGLRPRVPRGALAPAMAAVHRAGHVVGGSRADAAVDGGRFHGTVARTALRRAIQSRACRRPAPSSWAGFSPPALSAARAAGARTIPRARGAPRRPAAHRRG